MEYDVFISYSAHDYSVARFLQEILTFHGVDAWIDRSGIRSGDIIPDNIYRELRERNCVVVVCSSQATTSDWVKEEVSFYRKVHPSGMMIPFVIDGTHPSEISSELGQILGPRFDKDIVDSLNDLLSPLGKSFLPATNVQVETATAAVFLDRRAGGVDGERSKNLKRRLRHGFWRVFADATGLGKFQACSYDVHMLLKLHDILLPEASKFLFYSPNGKKLNVDTVLRSAIQYETEIFRQRQGRDYSDSSVYFIEAIAEYLYDNNVVVRHDRRLSEEEHRRRAFDEGAKV